jgi:HAD superfamily hydrolase (TIGR01509 family)
MPKAAILDIDGTLVDTNYQHALAWFRAFKQNGHELPIWKIHRSVGMGGDQLVPALIGEEADAEVGDDLRTAHDILYMDSIGEVVPFRGARDFITDLKDRGLTVILASSAKAAELEHYLDLLDVRTIVDGWTSSADVETTKPAPDLVEAARSKADTSDAVMVGDTPYDIEAAAKADTPTIAVLTGGFSEAELRDAGAAIVLESIDELRRRIDETPLG